MEELKEILDNFNAEQKALVFEIVAEKIARQAMQDYRKALVSENKGGCAECEMFFRSSWFYFLRGYNGEILIEKLKQAHKLGYIHKKNRQQENIK